MTVRPAKTQISLGIRGVRADAQADLSLRWAHSRFVGFVMSRPKSSLGHCHCLMGALKNRDYKHV